MQGPLANSLSHLDLDCVAKTKWQDSLGQLEDFKNSPEPNSLPFLFLSILYHYFERHSSQVCSTRLELGV